MQTPQDAREALISREMRLDELARNKSQVRARLTIAFLGLMEETKPRETIFSTSNFSPSLEQELAARAALEETGVSTIHRIRGAQRNGPCPCGSGKKFKRCCRTVRVK